MKIFWPLLCCIIFFACKSKEGTNQPAADEWILINKKIYTEKLNAIGLPDTTYATSYTYENVSIKDSTQSFAVSRYDDKSRLIAKYFYSVRNDSLPLLRSQLSYHYSGNQLADIRSVIQGILLEEVEYTYDTTGRLLKSLTVSLKNKEKVTDVESQTLQKQMMLQQGYDTVRGTYQSDAEKKVTGGDFVNGSGVLIRRDVNVYSGSMPLAAYSLGPKGDTLQRISYKSVGKAIEAQTENADYSVSMMIWQGLTTGKITIDKKNNIKARQDWIYVDGKLQEERFYKIENKKRA